MFDFCYATQKIARHDNGDGFLLYTDRYIFKTEKNRKYVLLVEYYRYEIIIFKFYPANKEKDKNKFSILTNENSANKIISTCIHLAVKILQEKPYCSFGFIGAPIYNKEESYVNTKRFSIYKLISRDLFGSNTFKHFNDPKQSAYMFVNSKESNPEEFAERAKVMFSKAYCIFEN